MKYTSPYNEYFEIRTIDDSNCEHLQETEPEVLRLLWFTSDDNKIKIDGVPYTFHSNQLICLTQFHRVEYVHVNTINLLRFNRQFYCVLDHDSEVGCKGVLYYGAAKVPVIKAEDVHLDVLQTAWHMAALEFDMKDDLQLEMLQMMLKRILILCTRLYKKQNTKEDLDHGQHDLVREFNYLVEKHFREKHSVAEYAELLFKAPKTISNTFKKVSDKSPLQYIHERIALEARRLLVHSEKDVSEIAHELGFTDLQTFSRFFKKQTTQSPTEFRAQKEVQA